jgi:ribosomal protein S27AE
MNKPDTDTIVISAAAGTKARWVHASQRDGLKLSDWVVKSVDRPANQTAQTPCQRCRSVVLVADGPTCWQCAQCGLAA